MTTTRECERPIYAETLGTPFELAEAEFFGQGCMYYLPPTDQKHTRYRSVRYFRIPRNKYEWANGATMSVQSDKRFIQILITNQPTYTR